MRIVFMGTPEFARANLACLCESSHDVVAVVTGRDKPSGRGQRTVRTLVCCEAADRDIPILQPKSLKSAELHDQLRELRADLFVVAAFRILPESLFTLPTHGSINVHASLLPRYRGAAPIQWALINGETETGLTSFFLKQQVDTGDIITQQRVAIDIEDTYDTLYAKLCAQAGGFLLRTLDMIESGEREAVPQDDSLATPAPKIRPEDALIRFDRPADEVHNFIRGLSTKPGAFTTVRGQRIKFHASRPWEGAVEGSHTPGAIVRSKKHLLVMCQDQPVEILRVVPQGKKEMDGVAFKNGFRPEPDERFGDQ